MAEAAVTPQEYRRASDLARRAGDLALRVELQRLLLHEMSAKDDDALGAGRRMQILEYALQELPD